MIYSDDQVFDTDGIDVATNMDILLEILNGMIFGVFRINVVVSPPTPVR